MDRYYVDLGTPIVTLYGKRRNALHKLSNDMIEVSPSAFVIARNRKRSPRTATAEVHAMHDALTAILGKDARVSVTALTGPMDGLTVEGTRAEKVTHEQVLC